MHGLKILFLVSSTGKFVPCFSQFVLWASQASGCSFPWDLLGLCMQGTDKCRECFWQRKIYLTADDLGATVMSDLWPLSSSFIWTLLLSVLKAFFLFLLSFSLQIALYLHIWPYSHFVQSWMAFCQTIKN